MDVQIANTDFSLRPLPRRVVHGPDVAATVSEDKSGIVARHRQALDINIRMRY